MLLKITKKNQQNHNTHTSKYLDFQQNCAISHTSLRAKFPNKIHVARKQANKFNSNNML